MQQPRWMNSLTPERRARRQRQRLARRVGSFMLVTVLVVGVLVSFH